MIRFIKKTLLKILILLVICTTIVFIILYFKGKTMYNNALDGLTLDEFIEDLRAQEDYVTFDELPKSYVNAIVAVEDHRFYQHGAVDIIAIARAFVVNLETSSFAEGGSTLTQQVAKNLFFIYETDALTRKVAEVFAAIELEDNYSKDEIIEFYVNSIYFGDGYYGIYEASYGYLNKDPSQMNLYECTMMAGIPNAPSVYAPTKNPDLTLSRQKKVISSMVENGYLSEEEAKLIFIGYEEEEEN